ncbi:hypothetical protein BpHYR1_029499 [Brachionus plicatilis]|uniref:Uncharacterized protein n=1 Tax=Brachionus plicatilis TaxID=10195 RepID=A0A3M7RXZ5_BRAPC|nr:hypothetical protein BpHYR1_029499 [Brachionus plicatilis]
MRFLGFFKIYNYLNKNCFKINKLITVTVYCQSFMQRKEHFKNKKRVMSKTYTHQDYEKTTPGTHLFLII